MSITVGDILRVVAIMQWVDGDIMQNVYNFAIGGSGGPFDDADIVADAKAWVDTMQTTLEDGLSADLSGSEIRVYLYDHVDDDWDEVGSDSWTWVGTNVDEELPRGIAALVNAKTLDPDVNGKKYIGGYEENTVTGGLWTAAIVAALADFAAEWAAPGTGGVSSADFVAGIWSVKNTNFHPLSGAFVIPTIPAYQRRRKNGVGI